MAEEIENLESLGSIRMKLNSSLLKIDQLKDKSATIRTGTANLTLAPESDINAVDVFTEGTYTQYGGLKVTSDDLKNLVQFRKIEGVWVKKVRLTPFADKENTNSELAKIQNVDFNDYVVLPSDKTLVTFSANKPQNNVWFWDIACVITPAKPLDRLYIKSAIAGSLQVGLIQVSGSTATIIHRTANLIPPIVGVNEYTPQSLGFPDLSQYPTLYVAILNVNSTAANRPVSFNNGGSAKNTPTNGGAVSDSNIDLSYWIKRIETKTENAFTKKIAFIDQVTNFDIKGELKYFPGQKATLAGNTFTDQASYWGEKTNFIGSSIDLLEYRITSAYSGNISIAFITISGSVATIQYEVVKSVVIGENIFTPQSLGVPSSVMQMPKVFVMQTNVTRPDNAVVVYNASTTQDAILVNRTTKVASYANYIFNAYLKVNDRRNPLTDKIKELEYNQQQDSGSDVTTFEGLKAALLARDYVKLGSGILTVTEPLVIPTGKTVVGNGDTTVFQAASGVDLLIDLTNQAPRLSGFKLLGTGANVNPDSTAMLSTSSDIPNKTGKGTGKGIRLEKSNGAVLFGLKFSNFNSSAIYGTQFGADDGFTFGVKLSNLFIEHCYEGIEFGTRAEYSTLDMITASMCVIGMSVISGNVTVSNSHFTKNRVGVYVGAGDNNSHGSFTGCLINHNTLRSLFVKGITNGHKFIGCDFFQGDIEIIDSIGVNISSSTIAAGITITRSALATLVKLTNNVFLKSYNGGTIIVNGSAIIRKQLNDFIDGSENSALNN